MRELKQALLDIEFLQECNNSVNLALSVTRKQLAAAEAELAAEREKRESLEKQNKELFPYYQDHLEGALIPATEYQKWIKRAEQAEAQCKRMEGALREISNVTSKCLSHEEMKDKMKKIAKAALEEKP